MDVPMAQGGARPSWPLPRIPKRVWTRGGKAFGAGRAGGKRYHAGVDILAPRGAVVVSPEDGVVVRSQRFNGPHAHALLIQLDSGPVVLLGEVWPQSWGELGVEIGSRVRQGQPVARVGINPGGSTMLHFEMYQRGTKSNRRWYQGRPAPQELYDPTEYLQRAANTDDDIIIPVEDPGHDHEPVDDEPPEAIEPEVIDPEDVPTDDPGLPPPPPPPTMPSTQTPAQTPMSEGVLALGVLWLLEQMDTRS